jgi:hypothetical protein
MILDHISQTEISTILTDVTFSAGSARAALKIAVRDPAAPGTAFRKTCGIRFSTWRSNGQSYPRESWLSRDTTDGRPSFVSRYMKSFPRCPEIEEKPFKEHRQFVQ